MRFRLLAGLHIDENGREYKAPAIVDTKVDLLRQFGPEKFQRLGDRRGQQVKEERPPLTAESVSFPAGQVHSGKQASTSDEQGHITSGPEATIADPETRKARKQQRQFEEDDRRSMKEPARSADVNASEDEDEERQSDEQEVARRKLMDMTVPQLREHANKEKIDLKGVRTKEEIVAAVLDDDGSGREEEAGAGEEDE